jgi:hypothetical protein
MVNQCELTYVNHIEPAGVWSVTGNWSEFLALWNALPQGAFLGEP